MLSAGVPERRSYRLVTALFILTLRLGSWTQGLEPTVTQSAALTYSLIGISLVIQLIVIRLLFRPRVADSFVAGGRTEQGEVKDQSGSVTGAIQNGI